MGKSKSKLPLALLAAVPLAYRLSKKISHGQPVSERMALLPDTLIPGNDFYLTETNYSESMEQVVKPYLKQREEISSFRTTHRINYAYYKADEAHAALVISHGYAETLGRYAEAIYYFLKMGYDVFLPEHFGHGDSDAGAVSPSVVWVGDFNDYIYDLTYFIKTIVTERAPALPVIGFGHSMGGAILARALQQEPDLCAAAIFTSPMFKVYLFNAENYIYPLVQQIARTRLNKSPLPGKTRMENLKLGVFKPEKAATHSLNRGRYYHQQRINSAAAPRWAVSWGWLDEAVKATRELVKPNAVEKITIPILMFQSDTDWFVDTNGLQEFARYALDLEFYKVPDSYHEIYSETDKIIVPYFNKINEFIQHHLANRN